MRKLLSDGKPHSTWDIMRRAKVCSVSSCIAELRCLGAVINCKGEGPAKQRIFYYTMTRGPREDAPTLEDTQKKTELQ